MGILDRLFRRNKKQEEYPDQRMEAAMQAYYEPVFQEWARWAEKSEKQKNKIYDEENVKEKESNERRSNISRDGDSLQHLEHLLRDENERVGIDAAEKLLATGCIDAITVLINALKDNRSFNAAAWAFAYPFKRTREQLNKEKLRELLPIATKYLVEKIEATRISQSIMFNSSFNIAISALGEIGGQSSLRTLEILLENVKKLTKQEGNCRQYVNTGIASGYVSLQDTITHIEDAITNLKARLGEKARVGEKKTTVEKAKPTAQSDKKLSYIS